MMKKSKLLIFLLAAVTSVTIASGLTLTGCAPSDSDTNETQDHQHSWSSAWSSDENGHWHACNDSTCDEKGSYDEHDSGTWVTVTPATDTEDGLEELRCTVCGYVLESRTIPATGTENPPATQYTVTFETGEGSAVASVKVDEGGKVAKPANDPTYDGYTFGGWYKDADCTIPFDFDTETITANTTIYAKWTENSENPPATQYTVTFETNGGSAIDPVKVDEGGKVTKPADPTKKNYTFVNWYKDVDCTQVFDFATETVTGNITLYAGWTEAYENVTTTIDAAAVAAITDLDSNGRFINDETVGKFTFEAGVKPEDNGATINTQGKDITIVISGRTNSISFSAAGGSTSGDTLISLYKVTGDGENTTETLVKDLATVANKVYQDISYGTGEGESLEAGTYIIRTNRSARIVNFKLVEELQMSDTTGISVSGAETKFLAGRDFSYTGLNVVLNYANGRQDVLTSGFTVDSAAVQMNTAGKYTVTVSFDNDDGQTFKDTYDVYVYQIDEIKLYGYSLDASRVTLPVQKLFNVNGASSTANLAVHAVASCPGVDGTVDFLLNSTEYTVSSVDTATAGEKTVTVSVGSKTNGYTVNVVDLSQVTDKYSVNVDVNGTVGVNGGVLTVTSVNDAIQAFKLLGAEDGLTKTITVAAGEYYEKVEIDIPNVKLVGSGETAKDTVLWFDALNGLLDPSGTTTYSTDGSATVSIRAEGFYAENITFKNYYNTNALYEESKLIAGSGTQAVACLVRADKAYFKNCYFTSYHDTLYADTGRQVYDNCEIEGRTDYIFGDNATAYFYQCTIRTIGANDSKNGGYIVATKGEAGMKFGYVFDSCTLTADENVVAGTVSLARGWESNMTLAFLNCNISEAYSLEYYGEATMVDGAVSADNKNDRYTKMNADPVATQLFEYKNTGAGALTEEMIATAVDGVIANMCTVLSDEQAAEYTKANIFAALNGVTENGVFKGVEYADSWNGEPVQVVVVTIKYGDSSAVVYGYAGGYLSSSDLAQAQNSLMPEGMMLDKYTDSMGAEVIPTEVVLTENVTYIMTVKEIPADALQTVATIKADDYDIDYSLKSNPITDSGNYITIAGTGSGDTKVAAAVTGPHTADDDSGLVFTNGFLPGGSGRTVTITAAKNCTITYYYTISDSKWGAKSDTISWTINGTAAGSSTETGTVNVARSEVIELKAGDTLVITPSGNRIITFAVVVQAIVV